MDRNCNRCNEDIPIEDELVKCYGVCGGSYHIECTTLNINTYRRMAEKRRKEWVCSKCRIVKKFNHGDSIICTKPTENSYQDTTSQLTIEEKIDTLIIENQRTNKLVQDFMAIINQLQKKLEEKDKEIKDNLHEFEQHYRNNYIELHNVPENENEAIKDLEGIVVAVSKEIGVEIKREEIEAIHRIPTKNSSRPKPIIVEISSRKKRNQLLTAKKGKRIIHDKVFRNGKSELVYINESLTKYHKELLYKSKSAATEKGYKFTWTKDGKIYTRKTETSTVKRIKNENDLDKL